MRSGGVLSIKENEKTREKRDVLPRLAGLPSGKRLSETRPPEPRRGGGE
jgi:hypothetical protein